MSKASEWAAAFLAAEQEYRRLGAETQKLEWLSPEGGGAAMSACGCRVEPVLAQTEVRTSAPSAHGWPAPMATQTHVLGHHIVYCATHAAAERLAEFAQDFVAMCGRLAQAMTKDDVAAIRMDESLYARAGALLREIGR